MKNIANLDALTARKKFFDRAFEINKEHAIGKLKPTLIKPKVWDYRNLLIEKERDARIQRDAELAIGKYVLQISQGGKK